jgi:hypothetical protein
LKIAGRVVIWVFQATSTAEYEVATQPIDLLGQVTGGMSNLDFFSFRLNKSRHVSDKYVKMLQAKFICLMPALLWLGLSCFTRQLRADSAAITPATFKGYAIGDKIETFLFKSGYNLNACKAATTIKRARKLKVNFGDCQRKLEIVNISDRISLSIDNIPGVEGAAVFEDRLLVSLEMRFLVPDNHEMYFEQFLQAMDNRLGNDRQAVEFSMIGNRRAVWKSARLYAELTELPVRKVTQRPQILLRVLSQEEHQREITGSATITRADILQ